MTADQKDQFLRCGCISRCIIKLAEWHNKPISEDDFVARFYHKYPHWSQLCGSLSLSDIVDICRELKIGRHADSYRDIGVVRDQYNAVKTSGVFMLSERELGTDKTSYHCFLIRLEGQNFRIWNPISNGIAQEMSLDESRVRDLQDKLLCHF